jgi:hypothetical protein
MKTLMILAAISIFSFSTAAARACDGMKDHADTQAKNENGKADGKGNSKAKDDAKSRKPDNGTNKS